MDTASAETTAITWSILLRASLRASGILALPLWSGRAFQKSVKVRWQKHVYHAMVEGRDYALQRAIREHGEEAFPMSCFTSFVARLLPMRLSVS
jgi:predicted RecA/RadA family phage recombinase